MKLSKLPKVDKLLTNPRFIDLQIEYPRELIKLLIREELESIRADLLGERSKEYSDLLQSEESINDRLYRRVLAALAPRIRRCINATGIVLHTGLGRSPMSAAARDAVANVTRGYSTLELEVETGKRGNRQNLVRDLLIRLTGAEDAAVVNNNAAATLITLNTLSSGKESIVSRGELVTIGGSFRIPDIMAKSGARMLEVGTTNQTWLKDYESAISENTGLLLKVHTSNYRLKGFVADVSLDELAQLGRRHNLPVVHDLGSGSFIDMAQFGFAEEPIVSQSLDAGADLVLFSGDKLLGGPQAGIILGKSEYVDQIKRNQLARALRCDKMTFAALDATLRLYFDEARLMKEHPVMQRLNIPLSTLQRKAKRLVSTLSHILDGKGAAEIESGESEIGGGSLADEKIGTRLVALQMKGLNADDLSKRLRLSDPPVIARIRRNSVLFDMRTVDTNELTEIAAAVEKIVADL
jgi:L-seryl-tRNA(Ser) seleniumtransferase